MKKLLKVVGHTLADRTDDSSGNEDCMGSHRLLHLAGSSLLLTEWSTRLLLDPANEAVIHK